MGKVKLALTFCGASLVLYACASTMTPSPPNIDFTNFTTDGKATKTVVTEWGTYELYDPMQDPEVEVAFNYAYARGKARGNGAVELDMKPYVDFIDRVSDIQMHDFARVGCHGTNAFNGCPIETIKTNGLKQCPKIDYGQAELNSCEAANIVFEAQGDVPLGWEDNCSSRRSRFIDIGSQYIKYDRAISFQSYFGAVCR